MAAGAAAAAAPAAEAPASGAGNPFQLCSNLYAEKNNVGATVGLTTTAGGSTVGGGQINAGQYLRALRMILRTSTAGTVATAGATSDMPWNILTQVDLVNVDGSEIIYPMGGYAHYLAMKYGRAWLGDPATWQDAAVSTALVPQFTLPLMPEVRWTAGVLANTDLPGPSTDSTTPSTPKRTSFRAAPATRSTRF